MSDRTYESDIPNAPILFPVGTRVLVKGWPVSGKVIGHYEGSIIVEVLPCAFGISDLEIDMGQ